MIKIIKEREEYQNIWERGSLHILQHYDWGELKATESWEIMRVQDDKSSILQIQTRKIPFLPYRFGYVPKLSNNQMGFDLDELRSFFIDQALAFVVFEFNDKNKLLGLENTSIHIQPQQSNIVDLSIAEDELFMAMDGKYRRNIKKASREGVEISIHQEGEGPISDFNSIMEQIFQNTKLLERDKVYYERIWQLMKGRVNIVLAHHNGNCIGAYLLLNDNSGCYELYGGVSKQGRDLEAGYALKWEAIKFARSKGLIKYDHWGVAPILENGEYDQRHELYRISQFKRGFGGKDVVFPQGSVMVMNKMAYSLFIMAKKFSDIKTSLSKRL